MQNTVATIGMFVDLPKEFKGTHMSRFIEVLNAHGNVIHVENMTDILHALQAKFHAGTSHLEIEFPYFMVKRAPVSGRESVMDYVARFDATARGREIDFVLTVKAKVTTLCPCSKAIAKYGAHNQRGLVTVAHPLPQGGLDRGFDRDDRSRRPVRNFTRCSSGRTKKR